MSEVQRVLQYKDVNDGKWYSSASSYRLTPAMSDAEAWEYADEKAERLGFEYRVATQEIVSVARVTEIPRPAKQWEVGKQYRFGARGTTVYTVTAVGEDGYGVVTWGDSDYHSLVQPADRIHYTEVK